MKTQLHKVAKIFLLLNLGLVWIGHAWCQDSNLTVTTFNCEFLTRPQVHIKYGVPFNLNSADKKTQRLWKDSDYRDAKFEEAAKAVAKFLAVINSDVLALTEVGNFEDVTVLQSQLAELGIGYPYKEVGKSRSGTTSQNVAVLSKLPLTEPVYRIPGRKIYLEEPDDPETENDTGISKGMRVTFQKEGNDFILYVLHLQSERGGHAEDQKRIAQASIVRRHSLPSLQSGAYVIIAGDLNDHRGQPTLSRIRGLDDVQMDLIQTGHAEFFPPNALDTRWTYEFMGIRGQIDHILLSYSIVDLCGSKKNIQAGTTVPIDDFISDHNAFTVQLTLPSH